MEWLRILYEIDQSDSLEDQGLMLLLLSSLSPLARVVLLELLMYTSLSETPLEHVLYCSTLLITIDLP